MKIVTVILVLTIVRSSMCIVLFESFFGRKRAEKEEKGYDGDNTEFDCKRNRLAPRIASAIVGGVTVRDQQTAPYIVAIGSRLTSNSSAITWYCGGALLSSTTVVTAAHCLNSRRPDLIRLGNTDLESQRSTQHAEVETFKIHPQYRSPESYHDIAIIELATPVKVSSKVRPICLVEETFRSFSNQQAYVMGWGAESVGGDRSEELQKVKVKIFENRDCDRAYSNSSISHINFPNGITDEQLCAGSDTGGKDACQGDSGGPLVTTDSQGVTVLVGVVSSGAGCGFKKYPGVYVRVSAYTQWLSQFI